MMNFYLTWGAGIIIGILIGKWIDDHYGGGGPRGGGEAVVCG